MKGRRKSVTAKELMDRLHSDPEWVRQNAEREAKFRAELARLDADEAPLVAELVQAGYDITSVYDLVNARWSYPEAIGILVKHLGRAYDPKIHEGIIRALTVKEARGMPARVLLDELVNGGYAKGANMRWVLANALTVTADATLTKDLRVLMEDDEFDDVRRELTKACKWSAGRRQKRRRKGAAPKAGTE